MTKKMHIQRLKEMKLWLEGNGKAPHWSTQKYLFDNGFIDFTPTGFTYGTKKMVDSLEQLIR